MSTKYKLTGIYREGGSLHAKEMTNLHPATFDDATTQAKQWLARPENVYSTILISLVQEIHLTAVS